MIVIENNHDIEKYFKKNLTKNEIIIGMGAGFISKYHEGIENIFIIMKQELIKKFNGNIFSDIQLSKYSWFNLGGPAELFLNQKTTNNY